MVRVRLPLRPGHGYNYGSIGSYIPPAAYEYDEFKDASSYMVEGDILSVYEDTADRYSVADYAKGAWLAVFLVKPAEQANSTKE